MVSLRIHDVIAKNSVQFYPNPASSLINANFNSRESLQGSIEVTDVLGRVVDNKPIKITKGANSYVQKVDDIANGIYFLNIKANHTIINSSKFIKE